MFKPGWWFGTFGLFFHILGIVTPTDEFIFFRGVGIPPTSIIQNRQDQSHWGILGHGNAFRFDRDQHAEYYCPILDILYHGDQGTDSSVCGPRLQQVGQHHLWGSPMHQSWWFLGSFVHWNEKFWRGRWRSPLEARVPSGKLTVCYGPWPFISWIYLSKMVIFHSYVSLPEGTLRSSEAAKDLLAWLHGWKTCLDVRQENNPSFLG